MLVVDYFENRSIFLTGATGFVGKVLLEKLLRSCPGIRNIYVLIRTSRGKTPQERLQSLLQGVLFHEVGKNETIFQKVVPIPGDIKSDHLGISSEDENILKENVSVVFHTAADVRFDKHLTHALKTNVEGTRQILKLARQMRKLSSFVYVSTAYCNPDLNGIPLEEIVYPSTFDPKGSFEFFSRMHELNMFDSIQPDVLRDKISTYSFSKSLAENLVQRKSLKWNLPACIVRPSMIASIYNDPIHLEGWVDNTNGFNALIYGLAHGVCYIIPKNHCDPIPVDTVIKIILLAAWETGRSSTIQEMNFSGNLKVVSNFRVYNACVDQFNPISQGDLFKYLLEGLKKTPFSIAIRPLSVKFSCTKWWWFILNSIVAGFPCIVLDFVYSIQGRKLNLMHKLNNFNSGLRTVQLLTLRTFKFKSDNVKALRLAIPAEDKQQFDFSIESINWEDFLQKCVLGVRRFVVHEDDSTIPAAIQLSRRIEWIYTFFSLFLIILLLAPFGLTFVYLAQNYI